MGYFNLISISPSVNNWCKSQTQCAHEKEFRVDVPEFELQNCEIIIE